MATGRTGKVLYLGAGHAPLGGAIHERGDSEATCTLLVPLAKEFLLQLVASEKGMSSQIFVRTSVKPHLLLFFWVGETFITKMQ